MFLCVSVSHFFFCDCSFSVYILFVYIIYISLKLLYIIHVSYKDLSIFCRLEKCYDFYFIHFNHVIIQSLKIFFVLTDSISQFLLFFYNLIYFILCNLFFFDFVHVCCFILLLSYVLHFNFCVCLCFMFAPPPPLQPAQRRRRNRSMSVCVPPSSYSFSHTPSPLAPRPKKPSTPPPDLSSSSARATTSPCMPLAAERDTFAGRLSKALETVLPLHSGSPLPRARQRRASLPALFSSAVGSQSESAVVATEGIKGQA